MNRQGLKFIVYLSLFSAVCFTAHAYYFPFTFNAARPMGMGNAFTAVDDPVYGIEYNPAALASVKAPSITLDGNWFEYDWSPAADWTNNYTEAAGKITFAGFNFGAAVEYRVEGDIDATVPNWDSSGNSSTVYHVFTSYTKAAAGYGLKTGSLLLGVNLHVISVNNELLRHYWGNRPIVLFDAGAIYKLTEDISFGAALLRFGGQLFKSGYTLVDKFGAGFSMTEEPASMNFGAAFKPEKNTLLALDFRNVIPIAVLNNVNDPPGTKPIYLAPSIHAGIEHSFADWLVCRAGVIEWWDLIGEAYTPYYESRATATLGVGFRLEGVHADIAVANDFRNVFNVHNPFQFYMSATYDF